MMNPGTKLDALVAEKVMGINFKTIKTLSYLKDKGISNHVLNALDCEIILRENYDKGLTNYCPCKYDISCLQGLIGGLKESPKFLMSLRGFGKKCQEDIDKVVKIYCFEDIINPYSTSISHAWEVLEHMDNYFFSIKNYVNAGGEFGKHGIGCVFFTADNREYDPVICDTAPHAICLASLRALGVEIE